MFKFLDLRNYETFEAFLNDAPTVQYAPRVKKPPLSFNCPPTPVEPLAIIKSDEFPSPLRVTIFLVHASRIYVATSERIYVFETAADTTLIKKIELERVLALSATDECLIVAQTGTIALLEVDRDYTNIGAHKFEVPYPVTYILIVDSAPLGHYNLLLADDYGDVLKLYCNVFKLPFNKRSVTFTQKGFLQRGQPVQASSGGKPWWLEKSQEFKIVIQDKKVLFELLSLGRKFVAIQFQTSLDIYRVRKDSLHLMHRIINEISEPGFACVGQGAIDGIRDMLCFTYGKQAYLFSYTITDDCSAIQLTQEGQKSLVVEYDLHGVTACDVNLFAFVFSAGTSLVNIQDFLFKQDGIQHMNEELRLLKLDGRKLIGVTQDGLQFLKLYDIDSYMNDLIQKLEFTKAMQVGVNLLKGEINVIKMPLNKSEIVQQMNEVFQKLAFTQCIFELKSNQLQEERIVEIIKFLIYTENHDYLFTIIKEVFEQHNQPFNDIITRLLADYQIPYMPDQYLFDLCNQKNRDLMRHLVSSLNLQKIEAVLIVKACDHLGLDDEMIYVCQAQLDFITPIVKLIERQPLPQKCYDYALSLIHGRIFTGEKMAEPVYQAALAKFIVYLFVPENLRKFLALNMRDALNIIFKLFQDKARQAIMAKADDILIKLTSEDALTQLFKDAGHPCSIHHKMYLILKSQLDDVSLNFFTGKLLTIKFSLSDEIAYETAKFLVSRNLDYDFHSFPIIRNLFLIKVLMACKFHEQHFEELLDQVYFEYRKSTLVVVYLYSELRKYQKAFRAFLEVENPVLKDLVFPWLQNLLLYNPLVLSSQNNEFIVEASVKLIEIDENKAHLFIEKHLHSKHYLILNALQETSVKYFASYIQFLFSNETRIDMINDQTKILYLDYQCKTEPKKVIETLQTVLLPLDEALKLTIEHKIPLATAYIHTKTGATKQALEIYTDLFLKRLKKYIGQLMRKQELKKQAKLKLNKKLDSVLSLIVSEEAKNTELWTQFLDQFFKENKMRTFSMPNIPKPVKDILSQQLSSFLQHMAYYVNVSEMFETLYKKYGELPIQVFRDTIFSIKRQSKDDYQKLSQTQQIYAEEKLNTVKEIRNLNVSVYRDQLSAWMCFLECNRCQNDLSDTLHVYIFSCQHAYHDYCVLKAYAKIPYCDKCNDDLSYKILVERYLKRFDQSDLKKMVTINTNGKKTPEQVEKAKRNKKNQLKLYDLHRAELVSYV